MAIRMPTAGEVEQLRLILSSFQDGSGMLVNRNGATLPGWRDFERSVAAVFNGIAQENKAIFDVLIPKPGSTGVYMGLSCKMRRELTRSQKVGRVSLELSNSAGKFWEQLAKQKVTQRNYKQRPSVVGRTLVRLVTSWHEEVGVNAGGNVDLDGSSYLVLSWSKTGSYQLHQFPIHLPDPDTLEWYFPTPRCLKGDDDTGTLFEWYGESGGQLKYYPRIANAIWASRVFQLEPLPELVHELLSKVKAYFPKAWSRAVRKTKR